MTGLEQMAISMLQKMTGLSPEQMQEMATQGINLLKTVDARLANMERMIKEVHDYTFPMENTNQCAIEDKSNVKTSSDGN